MSKLFEMGNTNLAKNVYYNVEGDSLYYNTVK